MMQTTIDEYPVPQFVTNQYGRITSFAWLIDWAGLYIVENTKLKCFEAFLAAHISEYGHAFPPIAMCMPVPNECITFTV